MYRNSALAIVKKHESVGTGRLECDIMLVREPWIVVLENSVCERMKRKPAHVRSGCVEGFDVDAYRRGLGCVESMHFEINMISVMPTYQQLCLMTTERSDDWNRDET